MQEAADEAAEKEKRREVHRANVKAEAERHAAKLARSKGETVPQRKGAAGQGTPRQAPKAPADGVPSPAETGAHGTNADGRVVAVTV